MGTEEDDDEDDDDEDDDDDDAEYHVNDVIGDCPTAYELVIRFYKYARNEYQNTMKLHPKK